MPDQTATEMAVLSLPWQLLVQFCAAAVTNPIERVFATAIFAKQKPRDVERGASGEPNLDRERNDYESRSCSNDG
jgi:hypothetical protein